MIFNLISTFIKKFRFGYVIFIGIFISILIPFWNNELGEVDNLFLDIDKGQEKNMIVLDSANLALFFKIDDIAEAYRNAITVGSLYNSNKIRYFSAVFCKKN